MIVALSLLCCVVMTWVGGLLASRLAHTVYRWDVVAFSAGGVIGVALLDLLPEALENAAQHNIEPHALLLAALVGFVGSNILERTLHTHSCRREGHIGHSHALQSAPYGALALSLHSMLDGLLLGLSFLVDTKIGLTVGAAILGHRFCDGVNVVAAEYACAHSKPSLMPLLINSLAPVVGVLLSSVVRIPNSVLPFILSGFAGFFIYLGASDLLPSSQNANTHPRLLGWTACGCAVIYVLINGIHGG